MCSDTAISYIAEKFFDAALSSEAKALRTRINKLIQAYEHRPFDPHSEEYKHFCRQQLKAIEGIEGVDLSAEKAYFESALQINL